MPKSEIIYVKGMIKSESDDDTDIMDSAWDDKKLTEAYDKALKIANAEVAKRVAMSTNTQHLKEESTKKKKDKSSSRPSSSKKKDIHWKPGMPCRSVYEGDGVEYEAFVLELIDNEDCLVRYLGYENSEIVPINSLKPTHGNDARTKQIELVLQEKADDGFGSQSPNLIEDVDASDHVPSPDNVGKTFQKKKCPSKKKKSTGRQNSFVLPEVPITMPNISTLKNLGPMDMPVPPPPTAFISSGRSDSEEQAISSMLLSWYMSGYYTGLYQGLKRGKEREGM